MGFQAFACCSLWFAMPIASTSGTHSDLKDAYATLLDLLTTSRIVSFHSTNHAYSRWASNISNEMKRDACAMLQLAPVLAEVRMSERWLMWSTYCTKKTCCLVLWPLGPWDSWTREDVLIGGSNTAIASHCHAMMDLLWLGIRWRHMRLYNFLSTSLTQLLRQHVDGKFLQLLFYHDEIVPGNVLHPDNTRRSVCFYISFLEWRSLLHSEFVWLPIALLRTQIIKGITGGLSHCLAKLFQSWTDNFHGRPVTLRDGTIRIFPVRLAGCIMDESAMHAMWCCKGASGRRPCMKCKNCVAKLAGATLGLDDGSYFRDICCPNITEFHRMTDEDVWQSMDHLEEQQRTISKKQFAELERNIGFTHSPDGLLAQHDLRNFVRPSTATLFLEFRWHRACGGWAVCPGIIVRWDELELEPDPRLCGSGHFLHPSGQSAIPETLAVGSLFWFQCWMESVWIGAHDDDAATSLVADATHSWYTALGALAGQMLFLPTSLWTVVYPMCLSLEPKKHFPRSPAIQTASTLCSVFASLWAWAC